MTTYWKDRYDAEMRARQLAEVDINAELAKMYSYYQKNIENEINSFVNRYALREGIDPAEVRKRADEMDVQLFADKAARYVKEKNFSDKANEELALYNLKMKMSRLELLKSNIDLELLALANEEMDYVERELFSAFQKEKEFQAGILGEFTNDAKELKFNADILVNQKFAGKLWSDRIWKRQSDLREVVKFATSEALLKGRNATTLVSQVVREMNVSRNEAKRLLVTEVARVQTEVQKESYKENDFDKYIYLAEPSACSVCSSLHNKVFDVKDMTPGVNASPMHPHCHCSTAPKSDRREMDDLLKQIEKERLEKSDKKSYNKSTGAVYGAWNDDNDKYGEIRKKHADMYYEAVRKRDKEREISKVARNSKFSKSDILEIYNHVFIKKHHLEDGYRRFDPDYDMAESWKRLRNGENIQEHDIILLQHELYELNLMKQQGLSYNEAHNRTNEKFNYQKALIKWKIKKG